MLRQQLGAPQPNLQGDGSLQVPYIFSQSLPLQRLSSGASFNIRKESENF